MAKISVNKCEHCGKTFPTMFASQKYCSKKCRFEAKKNKVESSGQMCWRCKNACGQCSWSQSLTPVVGWIAEPITIYDADERINTYDIKHCPSFIYG